MCLLRAEWSLPGHHTEVVDGGLRMTSLSDARTVISMEDWAEIRRLHRREGIPIKEIGRLCMPDQTVTVSSNATVPLTSSPQSRGQPQGEHDHPRAPIPRDFEDVLFGEAGLVVDDVLDEHPIEW